MINKINIRKKNDDGTYDDGDFLFKNVDLYNGCFVKRILEISPSNREEYNVKVSLRSIENELEYDFKPENEYSYYLVNSKHQGMKFYITDKNGVKYLPDKNGIISLVNVLSTPLEIVINLIADKYTVSKIDDYVIFDDINILFWSSENDTE